MPFANLNLWNALAMIYQSIFSLITTFAVLCCSASGVFAQNSLLSPITHAVAGFLGTDGPGHSHHQQHHHRNRVDTHAPAGLMGDHVHAKGEKMVEYKFMNMSMHGIQQGRTSISPSEFLNSQGPMGFMMAPSTMNMEMHMVHFMWAPSDKTTLYVMPMLVDNTMKMKYLSNSKIRTINSRNRGFGDLPFGALIKIKETKCDEWIVNIGWSAPTGDIDNQKPTLESGMSADFPYAMRLGKGSWAARPGLTYKRYHDKGVFGVQFQSDIVLGSNSEGYSASDDYRLNAWATRCLDADKTLAASFRVEADWRSKIRGKDADLMMMMSPATRPDFYGGESINFGYGVMKTIQGGSRLNVEFYHPVYQDLDGTQMSSEWNLAASWSKSF